MFRLPWIVLVACKIDLEKEKVLRGAKGAEGANCHTGHKYGGTDKVICRGNFAPENIWQGVVVFECKQQLKREDTI